MGGRLKLETYKSTVQIEPVNLHIYELKTNTVEKNTYQAIRGACSKLKNYNKIGIYENGKVIYTTDKIENIPDDIDFTVNYKGLSLLNVLENKVIYSKIIKDSIKEQLSEVKIYSKYKKYSCRNEITSSWIKTEQGYNTFKTSDKSIKLNRKYDISIFIGDDNYAYMNIRTKSIFESQITVADMISNNKDIIGLEVKNCWGYFNQTGTIVSVGPETVTDPMEFCTSLKEYYISKKKEKDLVEKIPDDTPIIRVQMKGRKEIINYYPQALKPIITREYIQKYDNNFSKRIDKYIKLDMEERVKLDQEFIDDIGSLNKLNNLSFEKTCSKVENYGFKGGKTTTPKLICGNGKSINCGEEYKVFNYGFYRKTNKVIKIGYLYPSGEVEVMKALVNEIYNFAKFGKYQGEKDQFTYEGLLDIQATAMIKKEYQVGSITDYKRAALELQKINDIDLVIALIPDNSDEYNPYSPFKTVWAAANIPSQMISVKTARLFKQGKAAGTTSKYYLHNIILGILGKTGGIPWTVKEMPGDVDCFVGLDVATVDKGIHFPACSIVFDRYGKLLSFYKPLYAQQGEKINTTILQEIFDNVIISYENEYGQKPKNIVIHRDGFNNEDSDWYENYFKQQEINYSIIEVRKNIAYKMLLEEDGKILNPPIGSCIFNEKKAYFVTTDMKNKKGSPNPLLIEKSYGDIQILDAVKQILYLSQLHVGSTHKTRLPITTEYADRICKNLNYVPAGKIENKLFFL